MIAAAQLLATVSVSLTLTGTSTAAPPQAAPGPFTCDPPTSFLSQAQANGLPTQLNYKTADVSTITFNPLGPPSALSYNGMGFHPTNNYLYALRVEATTLSPELLRIANDGSVTNLGRVSSNVPGGTLQAAYIYATGAFDPSGNLWVTTAVGAGPNGGGLTAYSIDVMTRNATVRTLSQPWNPIDWTYQSGYFWGMGVEGAATTPQIYRMLPSTGEVTRFAAPAGVSGRYFGAAWTLTNGVLGFADNDGGVTLMSVANASSSNPTFQVEATYTSPAAQANDGAACVGQPTTFTLAKSGPATVAPSGAISWTLVATNTGPSVSSGFSVHDTVPAGVTNVASTTPGCVVGTPGPAGTPVRCTEGQLAVGGSVTITITGTFPPGTTCVTNSATVLANESTSGSVASNPVQTCTAQPSMSLTKAADTASVSAVGDTVTYTFTVTNTGNEPISAVTVNDTFASSGSTVQTPCTASLAVGDTVTCTATYMVTADDVAGGEVLDTATATGTPASGGTVASNPFSVAVDVRTPQPGLTAIVVNTTDTVGLTP